MDRNAADRSGTLAPVGEEVRMSSEECGPNATQEDWPNELDWMVSTLDSFDKTFRPRLKSLDVEEVQTWHESAREE